MKGNKHTQRGYKNISLLHLQMPIMHLITHPDHSYTTVLDVYTESGIAVKVDETTTAEGRIITTTTGLYFKIMFNNNNNNSSNDIDNNNKNQLLLHELTIDEIRKIPWKLLKYGQTYARTWVSIVFDDPISLSDRVTETRILHLMHQSLNPLTMLQARLRRRLAYEKAIPRRIAVAMGLHARLGNTCLIRLLDPEIIARMLLV